MKTKKELKNAWKQSEAEMGVFQIRNIISGRIYIDSALDIKARQNRHRAELKFGNHRIKELQNDWKKFGPENFEFEILAELQQREQGYHNYARELKELQAAVIENLKLTNEMHYR